MGRTFTLSCLHICINIKYWDPQKTWELNDDIQLFTSACQYVKITLGIGCVLARAIYQGIEKSISSVNFYGYWNLLDYF